MIFKDKTIVSIIHDNQTIGEANYINIFEKNKIKVKHLYLFKDKCKNIFLDGNIGPKKQINFFSLNLFHENNIIGKFSYCWFNFPLINYPMYYTDNKRVFDGLVFINFHSMIYYSI